MNTTNIQPPSDQPSFYITFGFGHHHAGGSLACCYTIVQAADRNAARKAICALRQNRWSMLYDTAEQAGVDKYNLQYVDFNDLTAQNGPSY